MAASWSSTRMHGRSSWRGCAAASSISERANGRQSRMPGLAASRWTGRQAGNDAPDDGLMLEPGGACWDHIRTSVRRPPDAGCTDMDRHWGLAVEREVVPNTRLLAARKSLLSPSGSGRPMSRPELADACNAELARMHAERGGRHRWAGLTDKKIGTLERGEIRWPNEDYRKALCAVLGRDERSLGLYIDRPNGIMGNIGAFPSAIQSTEALDSFLLANSAKVPDGFPDPLLGIERVLAGDLLEGGSLTAELWQRAVGRMRRYPVCPPTVLWRSAHEDLAMVEQLLKGRVTLRGHRLLLQSVVVLTGTAGNLLLDIGQQSRAQQYFSVSQRAARSAGAPGLESWAIAMSTVDTSGVDGPRHAAIMLDRAAWLGERSPQRRRAWIQAARARAYALSGERLVALRSIDAARTALAAASEPRKIDFFDGPRLAGLAGATLVALGDFSRGEYELQSAWRMRSPTDVKGRALVLLDLAECYRLAGRFDESAAAMLAAARTVGEQLVAPIQAKVRVLRASLNSLGDTKLRSLDAELAHLLMPPRGQPDAMEDPLHSVRL